MAAGKYVAFTADTEAFFMPRAFEHFEGEFTEDIIDVCERHGVPFTWLIVVDAAHKEVRTVAEKVYARRKDVDEFSLHVHFKHFVKDAPDDTESFKDVARRLAWLREAKAEIVSCGLPLPRTFRYGAGDSRDRYYCIEDLAFLVDELGVRNLCFTSDRIAGIRGITSHEHRGNNVWTVDGGREITLLETTVYLDRDEGTVLAAADKRFAEADYALIGCHDYRRIVPRNLDAVIRHLADRHDVHYVTADRLGELVRVGTLRNA
jgi:peptidoglycan/xylan/chitin deacetylase (PgdA/CDA1 family)